ncbi:MAG: hypothetical protein M1609_02105 [Firmicutes bacterium]|nr:hypothetical protein [Bacillota bacterium]
MPKIICMLFMICLLLSPVPVQAAPEQQSSGPEGQLGELEMSKLEEFVEHLNSEIEGAVPELKFKELVLKLVKGDLDWQVSDVFTGLIIFFL